MSTIRRFQFVLLLSLWVIVPIGSASDFHATTERTGIRIDLDIESAEGAKEDFLHAGHNVTVRFSLSDTTSGSAMRGANPAAWLDLSNRYPEGTQCTERARRYLSGSIFDQSEIDMNVFYVVAMNAEPTITVVDPLFGFGGTKLLAMVPLDSPGQDWTLDGVNRYLYVSQPQSDSIMVIDTSDWSVVRSIPVEKSPNRLELQPDEAYLWITSYEDDPEKSGVTVYDIAKQQIIKQIPTGAGKHDLAFSTDNKYVFVTNESAGSVSIIDIRSLTEIQELDTGQRPVSIDYSKLTQSAYIAHEGDGRVAVLDGRAHTLFDHAPVLEPGIVQVRISPDGRFAFVPNPIEHTVGIIEVSTNRLIKIAYVLDAPDQITFTDENAYIRHRNSEDVLIVPLLELSDPNRPVSVIDFPGGEHPLGHTSLPSSADAIVQASGHYAVLVANPGDEAIYFYKEGMAAPMGTFNNYGQEPRAVLVVERNLREINPGQYETAVTLQKPGEHQVIFYLDAPQIVHCFDVSIVPSPDAAPLALIPFVNVETVSSAPTANQPYDLKFKITDTQTGEALTGQENVGVLLYSPVWQSRIQLAEQSPGIYSAQVNVPNPGNYKVVLTVPSYIVENADKLWMLVGS